MTHRTHRWLITASALLLGGLGGCHRPGPAPFVAAPPEEQDVTAEHEPSHVEVSLCDSPSAVVTFDQPIEEQVYQVLTAYNTGLDETLERLTAKTIVVESERYGLDPWLTMGVIRVESRFYDFSLSNKDARGLMQLLPDVGQELAEELGVGWNGDATLYNPVKNVKLGVAYLAILRHRFNGNLDRTLAAYNMGPGRVRQWMAAGRDLPTGYASLVLEYQALLGKTARGAVLGDDLRVAVTLVERRMAREHEIVVTPVADLDSDATPPGLVPVSEPPIEPLKDAANLESGPALAPEPAQTTQVDPEPEIPFGTDLK